MSGILKQFKNVFARSRGQSLLKDWQTKTSLPGVEDFTVQRRSDTYDLFVDLYWKVRDKRNPGNYESIYQRVAWTGIEDLIEKIETQDIHKVIEHLRGKRS